MGNFEIPTLPLSRERSASELHDNEMVQVVGFEPTMEL